MAQLKIENAVGSLEELKTRVKTYLSVGKQTEKRNLAFLRTAWRSERDPAARTVIADALYQSNPQDYVGQRALLDSFVLNGDVYDRLKKVAGELHVPVPGVASVLDLAAEGNLEALARAIELARQVGEDKVAREELAEGLADAAKAAPEELIVVLRNANATDREAATAVLSHGLVRAADSDHPFWPTLRKFMGAVDAELAAFARGLESSLASRIAQEKAPEIPVVPAVGKAPAKPASNPEIRPGG
jgi:D-alanyl-D-alanine carboxypeptidase/D-alanyl-D-alanine-endopeptidase (penicillin-binding protein 4)